MSSSHALVESGSDSEDDGPAAVSKHQRVESLRVPSAMAAEAAPGLHTPRACSASPASPSARWDAPAAPWLGVPQIPSTSGAREPPILDADLAISGDLSNMQTILQHLLEQNRYLVNEQAKAADAQVQLQGMVKHLCRELATVHGRSSIYDEIPPVYNPHTDDRPRPGAKDPAPREMEPIEMGLLRRQVHYVSQNNSALRQNIRRILRPLEWHESATLRIRIEDEPTKVKWKLWHFCFGRKHCLQSVLTPEEINASNAKKLVAGAALPVAENEAQVPTGRNPISADSFAADELQRTTLLCAVSKAVKERRDIDARESAAISRATG